MSLPFCIGDVVAIDEEQALTDTELVDFIGHPAVVKTMGLRWVKIAFEGTSRAVIVSSDKLKKVEDEDAYR